MDASTQVLDLFALSSGFRSPVVVTAIALLVVSVLLMAVAIFVRRRAEQRVAKLFRDYNDVVAQLSEAERIGNFGSFTWDTQDPSASFWSEEMYHLFGLVPRKKPPSLDIVIQAAGEKDRESVRESWVAAQTHSGPFSFAVRIVSPSGQARFLRLQGKSHVESSRKPLIKGVAHDVTAEIAVDQAKTEFVSLASHQLKGPITSIKWLSELLLKTPEALSDDQRVCIGSIHEASRHMIDIVNDLLSVSRIELGALQFHVEAFDLKEIVQSVVEEQQQIANEKNIHVEIKIEPELPRSQADKSFVRMMFQNLFSNAIKYTPRGGSVTCEISQSDASRDSIGIRVIDTGIGIPADARDKVFKKLYRAPNAKAAVPDGAGLGLYVVKTILERVHGNITFDSVEGKGTTFNVSFPLVWEANVENARNTQK